MTNEITNKLNKKENSELLTEFEVESKLDILVEGQTNNWKELKAIRDDLQKGFIGLALRNQELFQQNNQLSQQLEILVDELNAIKEERQEKVARKGKVYPSVTHIFGHESLFVF